MPTVPTCAQALRCLPRLTRFRPHASVASSANCGSMPTTAGPKVLAGRSLSIRNGVEGFNAMIAREAPGMPKLHPAIAATQPFAVPVTFLQPDTERNRRALGYDMYSDPIRRDGDARSDAHFAPDGFAARSCCSRKAAARRPGFLIYMPVFATTATGRELKGYHLQPVQRATISSPPRSSSKRPGSIGIRIYDGAVAPDNLLRDVRPRRGFRRHPDRADHHRQSSLDAATRRTWRNIAFRPVDGHADLRAAGGQPADAGQRAC